MDLTITKYYNARQNVLKMCQARGYEVSPKLFTVTPLEFKTLYECKDKDKLHITSGIKHRDNSGKLSEIDNVVIFFSVLEVCKFDQIVEFAVALYPPNVSGVTGASDIAKSKTELMKIDIKTGKYHFIVIQKEFDKMPKDLDQYEGNQNVEFHNLAVVSVDTLNHIYQPKIIKLSNKDGLGIINQYNGSSSMMSTMCVDDPVNKYFNGDVGQVYAIIRSGTCMTYRVVTSKRINTIKNAK